MSNDAPSSAAAPKRKPRISLAIATALGLGYIPKAPGTFGSLAGVALTIFARYFCFLLLWATINLAPGVSGSFELAYGSWTITIVLNVFFEIALIVAIGLLGVWTASRAAAYLGAKDPQIIVIDEVSGQYLALWVGGLWPGQIHTGSHWFIQDFPLNWKCVLAGFILFRVFDIWKPFPARQAESLPRGWGIMADDWIAGLYAALGLWILRALGL
jgi:phosphatidylglycerophosphatase A